MSEIDAPAVSRPPGRDGWEKADIISKILGSVVIAFAAFLVKCGTDNVANSLQTQQLAQQQLNSVITQLNGVVAVSDSSKKRDLALIAMNATTPKGQNDAICAISEQIVNTELTPQNGQSDEALRSVAFRILEGRCQERAEESRQLASRLRVLSNPNPSNPTNPYEIKPDVKRFQENVAQLVPGKRAIVYLQYRNDWTDAEQRLKLLHEALAKDGFYSPRGDEQIHYVQNGQPVAKYKFNGDVRYFHSEDQATAESVLKIIRSTLGETRYALNNLSGSVPAPLGQIEVWCSPDFKQNGVKETSR